MEFYHMNTSTKIVVLALTSSIAFTGCMNPAGSNRYQGGFTRMEYSNVQHIYGHDEPIMTREELSKYNGIRIGADGYVKSLVQLPQPSREDLPHYTYTPPEYFRENYEIERGWRK